MDSTELYRKIINRCIMDLRVKIYCKLFGVASQINHLLLAHRDVYQSQGKELPVKTQLPSSLSLQLQQFNVVINVSM